MAACDEMRKPRVPERWGAVSALDNIWFQQLTTITRCIHLNRAIPSYHRKMLEPLNINRNYPNIKAKVLWFSPTQPMTEHNQFGNVSFTVSWKTVVAHYGSYLYYIDRLDTSHTIYTRVLLTNTFRGDLKLVKPGGQDMPFQECGYSDFAATTSGSKKHVLEIAIEADEATGKWLYENSKIETNNHSCANTVEPKSGRYKAYVCHAHNSNGELCPKPFTRSVTEQILEKSCPGMLKSSDLVLQEAHSDLADDDWYSGLSSSRSPFSGVGFGGGTPQFSSAGGLFSAASRSSAKTENLKQTQDEEWSLGAKVGLGAVVVGGLALFAGLAAAFGGDDNDRRQGNRRSANGTQ